MSRTLFSNPTEIEGLMGAARLRTEQLNIGQFGALTKSYDDAIKGAQGLMGVGLLQQSSPEEKSLRQKLAKITEDKLAIEEQLRDSKRSDADRQTEIQNLLAKNAEIEQNQKFQHLLRRVHLDNAEGNFSKGFLQHSCLRSAPNFPR